MREYQQYEDEMSDFILRKQLCKNQLAESGNTPDDAIALLDAIHRCDLGIALIKSFRGES